MKYSPEEMIFWDLATHISTIGFENWYDIIYMSLHCEINSILDWVSNETLIIMISMS